MKLYKRFCKPCGKQIWVPDFATVWCSCGKLMNGSKTMPVKRSGGYFKFTDIRHGLPWPVLDGILAERLRGDRE